MSHRSEEAGGDRHAGGLHGGRGASRSTRIRHALRAVKEGNASLLHAADEAGLLQRICRVIVEEGGYRTAFVGYADEGGGGRIRIVAHARMEGRAHEGAGFAAAKLADAEGPLGAALRTGEPAVGTMFAEDAQLAFWQDEARKQGHAAATAFPLRVEGATIGALCICAAEPTAFEHHAADPRLWNPPGAPAFATSKLPALLHG